MTVQCRFNPLKWHVRNSSALGAIHPTSPREACRFRQLAFPPHDRRDDTTETDRDRPDTTEKHPRHCYAAHETTAVSRPVGCRDAGGLSRRNSIPQSRASGWPTRSRRNRISGASSRRFAKAGWQNECHALARRNVMMKIPAPATPSSIEASQISRYRVSAPTAPRAIAT